MPDPDEPGTPARFDCDSCQHGKPAIGLPPKTIEQRQYLHCGYMPESEWLTASPGDGNLRVPSVIGAGVDVPGVHWAQEDKDTGEIEPNICPGYAVRVPVVIECCQAHKAFDKGALEPLFPEISNAVAEGVQELSRAFDEFTRQRMTEIQRRTERHG